MEKKRNNFFYYKKCLDEIEKKATFDDLDIDDSDALSAAERKEGAEQQQQPEEIVKPPSLSLYIWKMMTKTEKRECGKTITQKSMIEKYGNKRKRTRDDVAERLEKQNHKILATVRMNRLLIINLSRKIYEFHSEDDDGDDDDEEDSVEDTDEVDEGEDNAVVVEDAKNK